MRVYTVHMRRHGLDTDHDIVLVKEGFCWPAFLFSVLWALWCRLWWVALGLLAVEMTLGAAMVFLGADPLSQAALSAGVAVVVGLAANDLKRWTLDRRGFRQISVVAADDAEAAERRFFDHHPQLTAELR